MHPLLHYVCCVPPKTTICSKYLHGGAELLDDNETSKVQGFPGRMLLSARQFGLSELVFVDCQQGRVTRYSPDKKGKYTPSTMSVICIIMLTQRSSCLPSSINHKKKEQRSRLENKIYNHQFLLLEMLSLLPHTIKELWVSWSDNVVETFGGFRFIQVYDDKLFVCNTHHSELSFSVCWFTRTVAFACQMLTRRLLLWKSL